MPKCPAEILLAFPARALDRDESALVDEWLALAGDISIAYVSQRRSDDPRLYRRIVIIAGPTDRPSHIVHAPSGASAWLVTTLGPPVHLELFDSLRDALNWVRPVLP
jgi:hypothetical protein